LAFDPRIGAAGAGGGPGTAATLSALAKHRQANLAIFSKPQVKSAFHVDFMPIDLQGTPELLVDLT
jgi:hypothetical protein